MMIGDAIFTSSFKDEHPGGWVSYKAPKGRQFVFLVLGTVEKDAADFDVDGALNSIGWQFTPATGGEA
jgi:hypothetical protein